MKSQGDSSFLADGHKAILIHAISQGGVKNLMVFKPISLSHAMGCYLMDCEKNYFLAIFNVGHLLHEVTI